MVGAEHEGGTRVPTQLLCPVSSGASLTVEPNRIGVQLLYGGLPALPSQLHEAVGTVPRAHDTARGPQKCLNFF